MRWPRSPQAVTATAMPSTTTGTGSAPARHRLSCCNGSVDGRTGDCRPAPSYVGEDGFYRVWDGREWLRVPKSKIITMPTPDRGTHLCETYGKVFCFITGGPSS